MHFIESFALFQIAIAVVLLLGSTFVAFRAFRVMPPNIRIDLRRVIGLIFFISAAYILFVLILLGNLSYPIQSVTASTLLGAACFVYVVISLIISFAKRITDKDNEIVSYLSLLTDKTEKLEREMKERIKAEEKAIEYQGHLEKEVQVRRRTEEQIAYLAYYDSLTNLPNRVLFLDRLSQALEHARRHNRMVAILFLDLDQFKRINDTLGHTAGDALLRGVAERLARCLRKSDAVSYWADEGTGCVSRLGGDEFVIFLNEVAHVRDAEMVTDRIMETISHPYLVEGQEVFVTSSIGISMYPLHGEDATALLKNSDMAMYQAKELGRNNYQFFNSSMTEAAFEKLSLENSLRGALRREEFQLYYQPQIDIRAGRIICMEALIRWEHRERGMISPAEFIPIAEENGLIVPIGEWVIKNACMHNKSWQSEDGEGIGVAVNLSSHQFRQQRLVETVKSALSENRIDPGLIELELTESIIMRDAEETILTLKKLKDMGIRISIDDFGTGYSSLSYLKRFPIDALKIDASFVRDIATNADDAAITRTIISMAHNLNLKVVAEGVETEEQRDFLMENGCDVMQGYLFCAPVPEKQAAELVARETWV